LRGQWAPIYSDGDEPHDARESSADECHAPSTKAGADSYIVAAQRTGKPISKKEKKVATTAILGLKSQFERQLAWAPGEDMPKTEVLAGSERGQDA